MLEQKNLAIGDHCWVCDGRCRYGQCPDCGGHSEHNYGCPQTTTHRGGA